MSIPTSFNPLGTLGGKWPRELLDGLLDGWLMRAPERTARGVDVIPPTTTTGNGAYTYNWSTETPWEPKTLLFCSHSNIHTRTAYNSPAFLKNNNAVKWCVYFYGITNLQPGDPLETVNGIIVDAPARYKATSFKVPAPFDAAVTYDGNSWRAFAAGLGWLPVPRYSGSYTAVSGWRYCTAWAAYDSVLSDSEVELRLGILRQFANS